MKKSCESVEINGVKYVRVDLADLAKNATNGSGLDYVIVRARDAGVHAGYLVHRDDENKIAELAQARRLWRWHGRTLTGLALEGTDDPSRCKFGDPIGTPEKPHTIGGWCEVLPCTRRAMESLQGIKRWEND